MIRFFLLFSKFEIRCLPTVDVLEWQCMCLLQEAWTQSPRLKLKTNAPPPHTHTPTQNSYLIVYGKIPWFRFRNYLKKTVTQFILTFLIQSSFYRYQPYIGNISWQQNNEIKKKIVLLINGHRKGVYPGWNRKGHGLRITSD